MRIANSPGQRNARRVRAAARLKKTIHALETLNINLTDERKAEIEQKTKELAILESRMIPPTVAVMVKNKKYRGVR